MKRRFLSLAGALLLTLMVPLQTIAASNVVITGIEIDEDYLNPDLHSILVRVSSPYEVTSVEAEMDGSKTPLYKSCPSHMPCIWLGELSTAGFSPGLYPVTITAKDSMNREAQDSSSIMVHSAPVITVSEPKDFSVVSSAVRFKVSAADDFSQPVMRIALYSDHHGFEELSSGPASYDRVVDLSKYKGDRVRVQIDAYDEQRKSTTSYLTLYVEENALLQSVAGADAEIVDYDESRFLTRDSRGVLTIQERSSGAKTVIWNQGGETSNLHLTPGGAIFAVRTDAYQNHVMMWKNNELIELNGAASGAKGFSASDTDSNTRLLQVNGTHAAYRTTEPSLFIVDLNTGISQGVEALSATNGAAFTADGELFTVGAGLYKYNMGSGEVTKLYSNGAYEYFGPVVDGGSILFDDESKLYIYNEGKVSTFSNATSYPLQSLTDYRMAQGWVAYLKKSSSGAKELYLKSPQGTEQQLTHSGNTDKKISFLAKDGSIAYEENGTMYLRTAGSEEAVSVGRAKGAVEFLGGKWYRTLGNTLYEIKAAPSPDDTVPPEWPVEAPLSVSGVTYSSAVLEWQQAADNTGVALYRIYRDGSEIASVSGSVYSYTAEGLQSGRTYEFSVEAEDAAGNRSVVRPAVSVQTPPGGPSQDTTAPQWPAGGELTVTELTYASARLQWEPAADEVGVTAYHIYRDGVEIGSVAGSVYGYAASGLNESTEYRFTVEASDAAGNRSSTGPQALVVTPAAGGQAPAAGVTLKMKPGMLEVGDTAEITIRADQAKDLFGFLARLDYDASRFKLTQVNLHPDFGKEGITAVAGKNLSTPGMVKISASLLGSAVGRTGTPGLATFKFTALKNGPAEFTVMPETYFSDKQGRSSNLAAPVKLTVLVGGGDFDGDGAITLLDLVTIAKQAGSAAKSSSTASIYDLNSDGVVDISDVQLIANKAVKE